MAFMNLKIIVSKKNSFNFAILFYLFVSLLFGLVIYRSYLTLLVLKQGANIKKSNLFFSRNRYDATGFDTGFSQKT